MTRIRKFFIQSQKFFREYSQGDLTAKVLSLECFVLYGNCCAIFKILKHIIFNKIINHVTALISPWVPMKQIYYSTTQQLILFLKGIHNAVSKGYQLVPSTYLDSKKAFDSVPHTNLPIKLRSFGITGSLWEWFKSYLTNLSILILSMDSFLNLCQCFQVFLKVTSLDQFFSRYLWMIYLQHSLIAHYTWLLMMPKFTDLLPMLLIWHSSNIRY